MAFSTLLSVLLDVVAPVVAIAGAGYSFGCLAKVDSRPIARLAFHVLTPCLVFGSLSRTDWMDSNAQTMVVFMLFSAGVLTTLAWLTARALRLRPPLSDAFLLVCAFTNAGNFGLPLNLFAFGQPGLDLALVCYVVSALLINSAGVFIASRGRSGARRALLNVVKAPLIWAALAGFLISLGDWVVPEPLSKAIDLAGQGAVPVMLLVLGMQLAHISLADSKRAVMAATLLKLVLAPLVALGLTGLLGMRGLVRQVGTVEASMPTAVMTTILAAEFDSAPRFTASVVFVSTILSLFSLTFLLAWLR